MPPDGLLSGQRWQAVRYVVAGGGVYALDVGLFVLLTLVLPSGLYVPANYIAKAGAAAAGFFLHRSFTFQVVGNPHRQALRYALLLIVNATASSVLLYAGSQTLGLPPLSVKIGADVITIIAAFLVSRHFVFQHATP